MEVSRTFDMDHGAVNVELKDSFGKTSFHTIYVAGVEDVNAEVARREAELETAAGIMRERMKKAGWTE